MIETLAAAACDEHPRAAAHARSCAACADVLGQQRELRTLARTLPVPVLADERRAELAAELLAHAEAPPHRGARIVVYVAVAAAALIAAAIWAGRDRATRVQELV